MSTRDTTDGDTSVGALVRAHLPGPGAHGVTPLPTQARRLVWAWEDTGDDERRALARTWPAAALLLACGGDPDAVARVRGRDTRSFRDTLDVVLTAAPGTGVALDRTMALEAARRCRLDQLAHLVDAAARWPEVAAAVTHRISGLQLSDDPHRARVARETVYRLCRSGWPPDVAEALARWLADRPALPAPRPPGGRTRRPAGRPGLGHSPGRHPELVLHDIAEASLDGTLARWHPGRSAPARTAWWTAHTARTLVGDAVVARLRSEAAIEAGWSHQELATVLAHHDLPSAADPTHLAALDEDTVALLVRAAPHFTAWAPVLDARPPRTTAVVAAVLDRARHEDRYRRITNAHRPARDLAGRVVERLDASLRAQVVADPTCASLLGALALTVEPTEALGAPAHLAFGLVARHRRGELATLALERAGPDPLALDALDAVAATTGLSLGEACDLVRATLA